MMANMSPVLFKMKNWYLNRSINEKIFGQNKTLYGFIGAIIFELSLIICLLN
jgi:hypothetical protein